MWTMFLCWACGGNRFPDGPPAVERGVPWSDMALPEGRTVSSAPDGLVVRYPHGDVSEVDARWRDALTGAGYELTDDRSRGALVSCTWSRDDTLLALSVSAVGDTTTVSLQELEPVAVEAEP